MVLDNSSEGSFELQGVTTHGLRTPGVRDQFFLSSVVLCYAHVLGATEGWGRTHSVERSLLEGHRDMWQRVNGGGRTGLEEGRRNVTSQGWT